MCDGGEVLLKYRCRLFQRQSPELRSVPYSLAQSWLTWLAGQRSVAETAQWTWEAMTQKAEWVLFDPYSMHDWTLIPPSNSNNQSHCAMRGPKPAYVGRLDGYLWDHLKKEAREACHCSRSSFCLPRATGTLGQIYLSHLGPWLSHLKITYKVIVVKSH